MADDEGEDANMSVHSLLLAGVAELEAKARIHAMMADQKPTFMEVYGRGSIMEEANGNRRNLNVEGLGALDLRTMKPDGTPWNFLTRADRKTAR